MCCVDAPCRYKLELHGRSWRVICRCIFIKSLWICRKVYLLLEGNYEYKQGILQISWENTQTWKENLTSSHRMIQDFVKWGVRAALSRAGVAAPLPLGSPCLRWTYLTAQDFWKFPQSVNNLSSPSSALSPLPLYALRCIPFFIPSFLPPPLSLSPLFPATMEGRGQ